MSKPCREKRGFRWLSGIRSRSDKFITLATKIGAVKVSVVRFGYHFSTLALSQRSLGESQHIVLEWRNCIGALEILIHQSRGTRMPLSVDIVHHIPTTGCYPEVIMDCPLQTNQRNVELRATQRLLTSLRPITGISNKSILVSIF
ncbi:hypothetical protein RRG08_020855 [Elysia crispata]|uniref:Uncharacterized protein n=1 Tax=Elysia crispata TaxID=231223 RepID=A0AAE0XVC9_9GAST|nr:hypothetical protein RRG08_020855 [Elysia crispata]